jgi:hypothetical protein
MAGLQLQQMERLTFVILGAGPACRWKRRRVCNAWNHVWDEVEPLASLQHGRRGAAVVLRLCSLRDDWAKADKPQLPPASLTSIDFTEARERFVRGDYPLRAMDDVIELGAGILRLLHGEYDDAIHTPRLVRSLLGELVPPAHLRPGASMDQRAVAEAVLERHRLHGVESPPLSPHQLRLAWLERLMRSLRTLDCGEALAGSRIFSGIRLLNRETPALRATSRLLVGAAGLTLLDCSLRVLVRVPWERVEACKQVRHWLHLEISTHQKPLRLHTPCASEISVLLSSAHPQQSAVRRMQLHAATPAASERESRGYGCSKRASELVTCEPLERAVLHADSLVRTPSDSNERESRQSRRSFFSWQGRLSAPRTPGKYAVRAEQQSAGPGRQSRWLRHSILHRQSWLTAEETVYRGSNLSITTEVMEEGDIGRRSAVARLSSWSLKV